MTDMTTSPAPMFSRSLGQMVRAVQNVFRPAADNGVADWQDDADRRRELHDMVCSNPEAFSSEADVRAMMEYGGF